MESSAAKPAAMVIKMFFFISRLLRVKVCSPEPDISMKPINYPPFKVEQE
jgi:hypothetical protein